MKMTAYHSPVLLQPSLELLAPTPGGTYLDATFGGGGHSRAILERIGPEGRLIAVDQDPDAQANRLDAPTFQLLAVNFAQLRPTLQRLGITQLDGILADLGVSSHQFDTAERGFSFRFEGPLDMRMNTRSDYTAADLVNEANEEDLIYILKTYGELRHAKQMVRAILQARQAAPLRTTTDLVSAVEHLLPRNQRSSLLAQLFQALRIEVNEEMTVLHSLLTTSLQLLRPGGHLVVISYHSLEDRPVKHFLATGNLAGELQKDFYGNPLTPWELLTRKPILPSEEEIAHNPRARSARLRAARKRPTK